MSQPILEVSGVSKSYEHGKQTVLADISLTVHAGEFVAVLGQSGAGKSTLLNLLGLLDEPDSGSLRIDGLETMGIPERQRDALRAEKLGFVFQDSFVLPSETVARNVALPLRMNRIVHTDQVATVVESLRHFGLLEKADQVAGSLSGGERQRVAFARAIASAPVVLLADEPTGNLDSANTHRVMQLLKNLNEQGTTIVLITHSEEVAAAAGRRIRIIDGELHEDSAASHEEAPVSAPSAAESVVEETLPAATAPQRRRPAGRWHLAEALTALLLSPVRSATILAAFLIAVGGLVVAVNLTSSAADQVSSTLSAAALDEVIVRLDSPEAASEAAAQISQIEGVIGASSITQTASNDVDVTRPVGGTVIPLAADIRSVDGAYLGINGISVWPAQAAELLTARQGTPTVILGREIATEWGIPDGRVGDVVTIADQRAVIVGFITGADRDPTLARAVLVSQGEFTSPTGSTYSVLVRTEPGLPARIAEAIPLTVAPGSPESVRVQTVADLRDLAQGVNSDLASNVLVISAVLLVLVCLTCSISMFLTVLARTREIALRRAVGATRRDIRILFLAEGFLLGLSGGLAGASLGIAATTVACLLLRWAPTFDPLGALVAVLVGTTAGALSSVIPARRAALIEPARALRTV